MAQLKELKNIASKLEIYQFNILMDQNNNRYILEYSPPGNLEFQDIVTTQTYKIKYYASLDSLKNDAAYISDGNKFILGFVP